MNTQVIKASSRGKANYGWLNANYLFSFAQYYHPDRMHFGALRVFNDDFIKAGRGFDTHPHDNMEIITIPLSGSVSHKDSMGYETLITDNEVQVMSAGTGIFHSEFNGSQKDELNLFQLWIIPSKRNIAPTYNQASFDTTDAINQWQLLVAPINNEGLTIQQNAWIHRAVLETEQTLTYKMHEGTMGSLLMVIDGEIMVNDEILHKRDVITITDANAFAIKATENAQILNVEVPNI